MFNVQWWSSLQLPASRTAALVATLASATLGDVLFARLLGIILYYCHFLSDLKGLTLEVKSEELLRSPRLIIELAAVLTFVD